MNNPYAPNSLNHEQFSKAQDTVDRMNFVELEAVMAYLANRLYEKGRRGDFLSGYESSLICAHKDGLNDFNNAKK